MTNDVLSRVKHVLDNVPDLIDGTCGQVDHAYAEYVTALRAELDGYNLVPKGT